MEKDNLKFLNIVINFHYSPYIIILLLRYYSVPILRYQNSYHISDFLKIKYKPRFNLDTT